MHPSISCSPLLFQISDEPHRSVADATTSWRAIHFVRNHFEYCGNNRFHFTPVSFSRRVATPVECTTMGQVAVSEMKYVLATLRC